MAGGLNNGSVSLRNDSGRGQQPASGVSRRMPTKRQLQLRRASRRLWEKRAASFRAQGLTTRGTRRKYERHAVDLHGKSRHAWRQRLYVQRRNAHGLTRRGNAKRLPQLNPQFIAWRQFRAGIAVPTQTFCDAYMTTTEKAYK